MKKTGWGHWHSRHHGAGMRVSEGSVRCYSGWVGKRGVHWRPPLLSHYLGWVSNHWQEAISVSCTLPGGERQEPKFISRRQVLPWADQTIWGPGLRKPLGCLCPPNPHHNILHLHPNSLCRVSLRTVPHKRMKKRGAKSNRPCWEKYSAFVQHSL